MASAGFTYVFGALLSCYCLTADKGLFGSTATGCYYFYSSRSGFDSLDFSTSYLLQSNYLEKEVRAQLGAEVFFAQEGIPGSAGDSASRLNGLSL